MIENFTIAINIIPGSDAVIVLYLKVSRVTLDRGGGGVNSSFPQSREFGQRLRQTGHPYLERRQQQKGDKKGALIILKKIHLI